MLLCSIVLFFNWILVLSKPPTQFTVHGNSTVTCSHYDVMPPLWSIMSKHEN